jgi:hypothetical protein
MSKVQQHSRRSQMAIDAYNVLAEMGISLHTDFIARLVYHRRGIDISKLPWWSTEYKQKVKVVRDAIYAHPELFENQGTPGVFFLTGKRPDVRTYDTITEVPA